MGFAAFKTKWQQRSALKQARRDGSAEALAAFLKRYPEKETTIKQDAIAHYNNLNMGQCLVTSLALVQAGCSSGVALVEKLVDHGKDLNFAREYPVPWGKLSKQDFRVLGEYLRQQNADSTAYDLLAQLLPEQGLNLLPAVEDQRFRAALDAYLKGLTSTDPLTKMLLARIEDIALSNKKTGNKEDIEFSNCLAATSKIWEKDQPSDALALMASLSLARPRQFPWEWLQLVVDELQKLNGLDLVRAAKLLQRYPSGDWTLPLKKAWLRLANSVRHHDGNFSIEHKGIRLPQETVTALSAIAVALGACAALDQAYSQLESGELKLEGLEDLIREYNAGVEEDRRLVREYRSNPATRQQVEKQIVRLRKVLNSQAEAIEKMKADVNEQLSAGYLLLLALQEEQVYPSQVRQSAAWGFWKLSETGNLDQESRQKIIQTIRWCISEQDETELRAAVGAVVSDENLRPVVIDASLEYFLVRNLNRLLELLNGLMIQEDERQKVITTVRSFVQGGKSHHFRERVIQFLPGQGLLELEEAITDGLVWMFDLIEETSDEDSENDQADFAGIRSVVSLMLKIMPKALEFLSQYPLRLMTLRQHQRLLGQYSRIHGGIEFWTRYQGRPWHRGMAPEEVGKVVSRYLDIDDRSTPNCMGIMYRLFRHPILALPVIYHEHMHYGGPAGEPQQGIENETEVLLREIIFARRLIAQMAPANDDDIPAFEGELIREIEAAGIPGLGLQLRYDLTDDATLAAICEQIESTYGEQLSGSEADQEVNRLIQEQNVDIRRMNKTEDSKLNWQPEIEWRYLGAPETHVLTMEYRRILYGSLTVDHRIDTARRDLILEDAACRDSLRAWEGYKKRKHALKEFEKAWPLAVDPAIGLPLVLTRVEPLTVSREQLVRQLLSQFAFQWQVTGATYDLEHGAQELETATDEETTSEDSARDGVLGS